MFAFAEIHTWPRLISFSRTLQVFIIARFSWKFPDSWPNCWFQQLKNSKENLNFLPSIYWVVLFSDSKHTKKTKTRNKQGSIFGSLRCCFWSTRKRPEIDRAHEDILNHNDNKKNHNDTRSITTDDNKGTNGKVWSSSVMQMLFQSCKDDGYFIKHDVNVDSYCIFNATYWFVLQLKSIQLLCADWSCR